VGVDIIRIFYASDIHGSELCFRKFVNAGKFYNADVIILGGDITGKLIIPIVEGKKGYECEFLGRTWYARNEQQLAELEKRIRYGVCYPYRTTRDFIQKTQDNKNLVEQVFQECMVESISSWVRLAEERLADTKIQCYIMPGNDDPIIIDKVIKGSSFVINPENRIIWIQDDICIVSTGYTNITPWNSPREKDEQELELYLEEMLSGLNGNKCACKIFNYHCPPKDTIIDQAPKLDENLKPVIEAGQVLFAPAGSQAVRNVIERHKPALSLHGHIHESKGEHRLGPTLSLNAGSEYTEGILRGVIIELDGAVIKSYQFTAG